jgi:hypothetical protein
MGGREPHLKALLTPITLLPYHHFISSNSEGHERM